MTEEEIRADERRRCWEQINAMIVPGPLSGMGIDPSAQRNGLILAANSLLEVEAPREPALSQYREAVEAARRLLDKDASEIGGKTPDGRTWWRYQDVKTVARMFLLSHANTDEKAEA